MNKPVHGLGKGLGALLGDVDSVQSLRKPIGYVNKEIAGAKEPQDTSDILRIPIDMIEPNPFQPRMSFDKEALEELAESIRTFGLIQPVTVRHKVNGKYQIISTNGTNGKRNGQRRKPNGNFHNQFLKPRSRYFHQPRKSAFLRPFKGWQNAQ